MFTGSTVSITGNDTVIINGRNLINLAEGDNGALTHPNELMTVKTGKNGNTIYAYNTSGQQGELVLRLIRGSADDRFLNSQLMTMKRDPAAFFLMSGKFVKRAGDGNGFVTNDTYIMLGGVFFKQVDVTSNAEGNTDQAVAVYSIRWGNVFRAIL